MYEGLSIDKILKEFAGHPQVVHYLPDAKDVPRLPRQWILNVVFTVVGRPFADWVNRQVEDRNATRASEQNLMIDLDPEVAEAFAQSTHVSTR